MNSLLIFLPLVAGQEKVAKANQIQIFNMINRFKKTIQQAGDVIKDHASSLNEAVKAKGNAIIDDWVNNIPNMEKKGLKVTYFSLGVSISPELEFELQGTAAEFDQEKLQTILNETKGSTPMSLVFSSIKTAAKLRQRAQLEPMDPLTVRLKVRISPEIKVSYGIPICE